MSVTIKVKCFSCNNDFHFYFLSRKEGDKIKCPLCYAEVDEQFQKQIFLVAGAFADTNSDFYMHSTELNLPLFQFDLTSRIHGLDYGSCN